MDLVAIISVIASATVGLSAAGVSLYGSHRTARTARVTQVRQRKADAYLGVLRLMEAQAQWVTTNASNLETNSDKEYYGGVLSRMWRSTKLRWRLLVCGITAGGVYVSGPAASAILHGDDTETAEQP